jgi:hypothetical protein
MATLQWWAASHNMQGRHNLFNGLVVLAIAAATANGEADDAKEGEASKDTTDNQANGLGAWWKCGRDAR